jgi:hypothetical protein
MGGSVNWTVTMMVQGWREWKSLVLYEHDNVFYYVHLGMEATSGWICIAERGRHAWRYGVRTGKLFDVVSDFMLDTNSFQ